MSLYSEPPTLREFRHDKPTLLVCWWATLLCTCIILLRVAGRFVRTERLFREDRMSALALIPLFLRMGCVHYILVNGTNNSQFDGVTLTEEQIYRKQIASGLVLISRVLYAATLWVLKMTILEFLRRLADVTWVRSYQTVWNAIRWTLFATFIAVIISDLAECRPFNHYWQVSADPGGQCRQGYAQLITMAVCDVFTDLLLVFFPVVIILRSPMRVKRKIQLCLLFSLSLSVVGVTLYRVPHIISEDGRQQYRSLLASVELIFATASANALVLGSFVRDRGIKKRKFRRESLADSFDRGSSQRRPTLHRHWGSDEDLVRDVGIGVDPELQQRPESSGTIPASTAKTVTDDHPRWQLTQGQPNPADRSDESLLSEDQRARLEAGTLPRRVSFFDVGGLLDGESSSSATNDHKHPSPIMKASVGGFRRGSSALLQDLGGLLSPRSASRTIVQATELQPMAEHEPNLEPQHRKVDPPLQDAGGLLR